MTWTLDASNPRGWRLKNHQPPLSLPIDRWRAALISAELAILIKARLLQSLRTTSKSMSFKTGRRVQSWNFWIIVTANYAKFHRFLIFESVIKKYIRQELLYFSARRCGSVAGVNLKSLQYQSSKSDSKVEYKLRSYMISLEHYYRIALTETSGQFAPSPQVQF